MHPRPSHLHREIARDQIWLRRYLKTRACWLTRKTGSVVPPPLGETDPCCCFLLAVLSPRLYGLARVPVSRTCGPAGQLCQIRSRVVRRQRRTSPCPLGHVLEHPASSGIGTETELDNGSSSPSRPFHTLHGPTPTVAVHDHFNRRISKSRPSPLRHRRFYQTILVPSSVANGTDVGPDDTHAHVDQRAHLLLSPYTPRSVSQLAHSSRLALNVKRERERLNKARNANEQPRQHGSNSSPRIHFLSSSFPSFPIAKPTKLSSSSSLPGFSLSLVPANLISIQIQFSSFLFSLCNVHAYIAMFTYPPLLDEQPFTLDRTSEHTSSRIPNYQRGETELAHATKYVIHPLLHRSQRFQTLP